MTAGHAVQKIVATFDLNPIPKIKIKRGKSASAEIGRSISATGSKALRRWILDAAKMPAEVPIKTASMKPTRTIMILDAI